LFALLTVLEVRAPHPDLLIASELALVVFLPVLMEAGEVAVADPAAVFDLFLLFAARVVAHGHPVRFAFAELCLVDLLSALFVEAQTAAALGAPAVGSLAFLLSVAIIGGPASVELALPVDRLFGDLAVVVPRDQAPLLFAAPEGDFFRALAVRVKGRARPVQLAVPALAPDGFGLRGLAPLQRRALGTRVLAFPPRAGLGRKLVRFQRARGGLQRRRVGAFTVGHRGAAAPERREDERPHTGRHDMAVHKNEIPHRTKDYRF